MSYRKTEVKTFMNEWVHDGCPKNGTFLRMKDYAAEPQVFPRTFAHKCTGCMVVANSNVSYPYSSTEKVSCT